MTKIRVTKRAFPRRITYTHLVRPLMRHSSRIKLFTRNWPKSPVTLFSSSLLYSPPTSFLLLHRVPFEEKKNPRPKKKGSVAAIFMANPSNGSSLSILKKKLLQERSPDRARLIYFECTAREKFEESGSRRFPRNDSSKTGAKRGGWKGREEAEEGGSGIDPLAENIPSRRPTFFHETRRGGGG